MHAMSDTVAAIVKLEQEYGGASTASLRQLFRYATPFDAVCMVLGFIGAGVVGGAQPCMMVLLGDLVDVMGLQAAGADMEKMFNDIAIKMIALGGICFVAAWVGEAGFKVSGLRQSAMWRKTYLSAILRQDIGWFDTTRANFPARLLRARSSSKRESARSSRWAPACSCRVWSACWWPFTTPGTCRLCSWPSRRSPCSGHGFSHTRPPRRRPKLPRPMRRLAAQPARV